MGKYMKSNGLTLIELLVAMAIGFIIMALVSGVLMQSFKNMEVTDTHINLRQESNLIVSMLSGAHLSAINGTEYTYELSYKEIAGKWTLIIGNQQIVIQDYDIKLELKSDSDIPFTLDTNLLVSQTYTIYKKVPLNVLNLTLTDKEDRNKKFELSTIISRL